MEIIQGGIYRDNSNSLFIILETKSNDNAVLVAANIPHSFSKNKEVNNFLKTDAFKTIIFCNTTKESLNRCSYLGKIESVLWVNLHAEYNYRILKELRRKKNAVNKKWNLQN